MIKVLFQTRINIYYSPGGDLIQIENTQKYLQKLGVKVDFSTKLEPDLKEYDLVHLFNLMSPEDIYIQYKNAVKQCKKIVISTIYGLYTEFEKNARGGIFQFFSNYCFSPYQILTIKSLLRDLTKKKIHRGYFLMLYKGSYSLMKEIIEYSDMLLPNSEKEALRIQNEFNLNIKNKYRVIPNSVNTTIFNDNLSEKEDSFKEFKDCILCVARIEGRKSILNLMRAVKDLPYKLVFVGNFSQNQKKYVRKVKKEAGKNVFFLSSRSQQELKILYHRAKVHALVSWMETPGLSSLEAAVMNCNLVITKKGDTEEYFGNKAFYCEPNDVESIKNAIIEAYTAPINIELKEKILKHYTWEQTAQKTKNAYEEVLSKSSL